MKKLLIIAALFISSNVTVLILLHTPTMVIRKINVDDRGLISVAYTENGSKKALDFLTPEEFQEKFKITVTNFKD